ASRATLSTAATSCVLRRLSPIDEVGREREDDTKKNDRTQDHEHRVACHRVESRDADKEIGADQKCRRILLYGAGTDHAEDRKAEPAHHHAGHTRKYVAVVAVGLKDGERLVRHQQKADAYDRQIGAEIIKAHPGPVHVWRTSCSSRVRSR